MLKNYCNENIYDKFFDIPQCIFFLNGSAYNRYRHTVTFSVFVHRCKKWEIFFFCKTNNTVLLCLAGVTSSSKPKRQHYELSKEREKKCQSGSCRFLKPQTLILATLSMKCLKNLTYLPFCLPACNISPWSKLLCTGCVD